MANPKHLAVLKKGVESWREWRRRFRDVRADLSGADLKGANLSCAKLRWAELSEANLRGANLFGADLSWAKLTWADLSGANLSRADLAPAFLSHARLCGSNLRGANLSEANLSRANLSGADLSGADLSGARLSEANLRDADLAGAGFARTVVNNVDLSQARSLETIRHFGPSYIDVSTLYLSKGRIPLIFLRGCGVPENLIEYLPSLIARMEAIQFSSCVIAYSRNDDEFARRLHGRMEQENLRVWYAREDMKGGQEVQPQLFVEIRVYDKLLLVLSEHIMSSEWVKTEIRRARERELTEKCQVLFPIRLVPMDAIRAWECFDADSRKDLAVEIREYHIPDFSGWKDHDRFEAAFQKLLADLRAEKRTKAPEPSGP